MYVRAAAGSDVELLLDLLLEAFNWTGETRVTRAQMLADPHTARYLGGWKRSTDFGLVALDDASVPGEGGAGRGAAATTVVGAIWARHLTAAAPGYGYVADDVPELGMAVAAGHRGRGVGTALLSACLDQARDLGLHAVSLSVEDGNRPARALYERHGFVVVGRNGSSDTMLRTLAP